MFGTIPSKCASDRGSHVCHAGVTGGTDGDTDRGVDGIEPGTVYTIRYNQMGDYDPNRAPNSYVPDDMRPVLTVTMGKRIDFIRNAHLYDVASHTLGDKYGELVAKVMFPKPPAGQVKKTLAIINLEVHNTKQVQQLVAQGNWDGHIILFIKKPKGKHLFSTQAFKNAGDNELKEKEVNKEARRLKGEARLQYAKTFGLVHNDLESSDWNSFFEEDLKTGQLTKANLFNWGIASQAPKHLTAKQEKDILSLRKLRLDY